MHNCCEVLLLLILLVLPSASPHDAENTTQQKDDSSGIPPTAVNRPMQTNLPLLSVAKLKQKRQVQFSPFVPINGTNLMWVTWNNSLPNHTVSLYNGYTNRVDYVCKYKCDAGFYTPSKGPYCYYPSATEKRSFRFEILVNKENFEILEWKAGSYGSVPKNSVWTCSEKQIYVGKNEFGLGKVSTQDKVFYLPYNDKEFSYNYYKVLTINENVISQTIYNVRYNNDDSEIFKFPPEVMHEATISNYECHPVVKTESLSKTYEVQQRWDFTFSIKFGVKTSIKTGIPLIVAGKIEVSTEVRVQFTKGTTVTESMTETASVELIVPPNHSCKFSTVRHKEKVDIPFTALLRRTYGDGEIHTTSITGTYDSIQVGKIQAVVDRCELLEKVKPCPVQCKSSVMSDDYQQILETNVQESVTKLTLRLGWIFQQDHDPKHCSKSTKAFMQRNKYNVLEWPSQSPDLKIIENRWCVGKGPLCVFDQPTMRGSLREPVTTRSIRNWSDEALADLQGCFEVTDWESLCEPHAEDINGLTECIMDYITFCTDSIVPAQTVHCFPNNKPWVTKDIKALLNDKKRAFRGGNKEEVRRVQVLLKDKIIEAKDIYRRKLEWKLQQNSMREVWNGMKTITGFNIRRGLTQQPQCRSHRGLR
ncbi:natterin-4-like [Pelmatolapia mariae]|uniref:natterin-4-like n=1 Tax=Pelmatolapia mariae TaxID=158779 RepID=UPI003211CCE2